MAFCYTERFTFRTKARPDPGVSAGKPNDRHRHLVWVDGELWRMAIPELVRAAIA